MRDERAAPGLRWIAILGGAGFAAGFLGPLVFAPEANQGPLVGILITGPAGALLGALLYGLSSLLGITPRTQWRLLFAGAAGGVIATLVAVQPQPALRGYVYEATVAACSAPPAAEPRLVSEWRDRIAAVTWAAPRPGWERDLHAALVEAPGVLITATLERRKSIFETRKPWDRGRRFATEWTAASGDKAFYAAQSSCDDFPVRLELRAFESYELNGRIEPPTAWPPADVESLIVASPYAPVPAELAAL
jgi:hypothetical protein